MGDLGPPIIAGFAEVENSANLRLVILTCLGLFVALPLSLVRNISSLQHICAASIGFYCCVVLRVVLEAVPNISSGQWTSEVNLWRPAGMLQCFPIFSMALACQTNVFEVYAELPDATPAKMTEVVKGAVNLCTTIYITIGFFGYVAFCYADFGGDILTSFSHTTFIQTVKLGFCISVALSFPLVMFPCRTSVHSLLFRKTYQGIGSTELVTDYIPPARFNLITCCLIVFCLTIGILIPDIELVLGFVGSTMGASVCVIFPGMIFLKLTNKDTTERLAARAVVVIGVITLILGSYVNLEEASRTTPVEYSNRAFVQPAVGINDVINQQQKPDENDLPRKIDEAALNVIKNISADETLKKKDDKSEEKRIEPAIPEEPNVADLKSVNKEAKVKKVSGEEAKENDVKELKPEVVVDRDKKDLETGKDQIKEEKDEVNAEKLLQELQRQKEESDKILEKQKEILKELVEHKKQDSAQNYVKIDNQQGDSNQNSRQDEQRQSRIIPLEEVKQMNNQEVEEKKQQQPVIPQQQQPAIAQQQHPIVQQQQQPIIPQQQQRIVPQQQQPIIPQQQPIIPQQQQPVIPQQQQPIVPQQQQRIVPQQQQPIVPQQQPVISQEQQPIAPQQQQQQQPRAPQQQQPIIPQQQQPIVPQQQQANIQHLNNPNNFKQSPVQRNKHQVIDARGNEMNIQQSKNLPNNRNQQVPIIPAANKKLDEYNIKADIKQGLAAYDQEQRDLVHPVIKNDRDSEGKVPGRDLKEERLKRSAPEVDINCDNDPSCREKFSRNPIEDSSIDRDLTKFLQVGSRALLELQSDSKNNTDLGMRK